MVLYDFIAILIFILFIFILFMCYISASFYFVCKNNKFGSRIELKEILCWKLVTFSSRNPCETEESRNQRGNM